MADVKISQLPAYTGNAKDLRVFVMNNDNETETFKYSGFASPLKYDFSTNSYQNAYDTAGKTAGDYQVVIGGGNGSDINATNAPYSSIIGSTGCEITTKHNGKGYGTIIVGSSNCKIGGSSDSITNYAPGIYSSAESENNAYFSAIIAAAPNGSRIRYGADNNAGVAGALIGGGTNNLIEGLAQSSSIIGGANNKVADNRSVILGGTSNSINNTGTSFSSDARGEACILAGASNSITKSKYATIVGGSNNTISGDSALHSSIYASSGSTINSNGDNNTIIGSLSCSITGVSTEYSSILNSKNSIISSSGGTNAIYNSIDSDITGYTRVTMIGTNNRLAAMDDITYVENIHTFQTPSTQTQVQQVTAPFTGADAVNLALGGHARLYVNSNTDIETIGVRDGQSFIIQIQTDGNGPYTLTWSNGDLSVYNTPYTYVFAGGNSGTGTTGTLDLFRCEVFEDVIYVQRIEDFQ